MPQEFERQDSLRLEHNQTPFLAIVDAPKDTEELVSSLYFDSK